MHDNINYLDGAVGWISWRCNGNKLRFKTPIKKKATQSRRSESLTVGQKLLRLLTTTKLIVNKFTSSNDSVENFVCERMLTRLIYLTRYSLISHGTMESYLDKKRRRGWERWIWTLSWSEKAYRIRATYSFLWRMVISATTFQLLTMVLV